MAHLGCRWHSHVSEDRVFGILHGASGLVFPTVLKALFLINVWKYTHPATQHHIPEHLNPQLHCYRSTHPAMQHHIPEDLNPQLHCCRNTQHCSITSQNSWNLNYTAVKALTQLHSITSQKTCLLNYTIIETPSNAASHPTTPEYSSALL